MALITLISTSELTIVFLITGTLDLNFADIVRIKSGTIGPCSKHKIITIHKSIEVAQLKSITSS